MGESEDRVSELSAETITTVMRLYNYWSGIRTQCKPGNKAAERCGDLGLRVCDEWDNSFPAFCNWALSNRATSQTGIERINRVGHFSPGNCRVVRRAVGFPGNRKFTERRIVHQIEDVCDNTRMSDGAIGKLFDTTNLTIKAIRFGVHWNSGPEAKLLRAEPVPRKGLIGGVVELLPGPVLPVLPAPVLPVSVRPGSGSRRQVRGVTRPRHRVLPDKKLVYQIEDICDQTDTPYMAIGRIYGVSPQVITKVDYGSHWNSDPSRALLWEVGG